MPETSEARRLRVAAQLAALPTRKRQPRTRHIILKPQPAANEVSNEVATNVAATSVLINDPY